MILSSYRGNRDTFVLRNAFDETPYDTQRIENYLTRVQMFLRMVDSLRDVQQ